MAAIGVMIEGQEDLTWDRLFRIADAVEDLGFESLFRSDHLTSLDGRPDRAALALWPSLTALALRTERIRFGPMVCPMTFRHPVMLTKMAMSVDGLSAGRLDLGIGAGWNDHEHDMFGIPYPGYTARIGRLDEGARVIRALWSGDVTSFDGEHYRLDRAESHPRPTRPDPRIIMGGKGDRTLALVARHATEWNCSYSSVEVFSQRSAALDEQCVANDRVPATVRRSVMIPFVIGTTEANVQDRIDAHRAMFSDLPPDLTSWLGAGFIGGSPAQVSEQLGEFSAAGVERFMLQHNDLDDIESLELLAAAGL